MRRKTVATLGMGLLFYTLVDILIWQRIFEADGLFVYERPYHLGYAVLLVGLVAVGAIALPWRWAIWYSAAFLSLAFSGLEDVLYYWLDGRAIPETLPWLNANPLIPLHPVTVSTVLLSAALWLSFWTASLAVLPRLTAHRVWSS